MPVKTKLKSQVCPKGKWKREAVNMAYFAELDFDNIVKQVVVINDEVIGDLVFPESEPVGIDFLKSLYGQHTVWKQTCPEGNFRKIYAPISGIYNHSIDAFVERKPYNSWVFNPVNFKWEPPKPIPDDEGVNNKTYRWDEPTLSWIESDSRAPDSIV